MTEKKGDEAAPEAADVPPTRKHEALADEPPARESHLSLDDIPVGYPDDGPVSSMLRTVDHGVGVIELALLIAIFGAVVIVASLSAISDHFFHHQIGQWWNFVVRKGTFAIAMFGAAYATQQQRLLAMDLVSRRLSPRGRLVLGFVLKVFTVVIAGVLVYIGLYMHDHAVNGGAKLDLTLFTMTEKDAMIVIPAGAALILFHSLLHAAIDGDYLVRNKLPPERARSGH